MSIRQIFITIATVMTVSAVFADSSSVTSRKYVDDFMANYQDKIPGSGTDKLMIYDESPDGIGEKNIVSSLGSSTSAADVPNVGAVKAGMDGKQDTINGTAGYVMTGMGTDRPGEVGERGIYGAAFYGNSLVTAENVNDGVINAVNSSLIRVDANGNPSDNGTLWEINTDLFAIGVLPAGYTQLEWIESNGTQYIDTGLKLNQDSRVEVGWNYYDFSSLGTSGRIFGARYTSGLKNSFTIGTNSGKAEATTLFFQYGNNYAVTNGFNITEGADIDIVADGTIFTINGTQYGSDFSITSFETPYTLKLFAFGQSASASEPESVRSGIGRCRYFRIYNGTTLVRNLVPAKNSSNVVGMYDTVSGTFFTDAAGGNFIAGPPVAN